MATGIDAIGALAQNQAASLLRELSAATAGRLLASAQESATAYSATIAPSTAQPHAATSPQMLGSVQMLVALSAMSPQEVRRQERLAQARRGLDGLDRLHRELLAGVVSQPALDQLRHWLVDEQTQRSDNSGERDDPHFTRFCDEIDLRVRVELAKFNIEA